MLTLLEKYPYEFEINSSLQLASIDGVKVASNETPSTEYVKKSDYDALLARVVALENNSNSQSSSLSTSVNYSTDEQDTGLKWIDGKTIYQKTVDIGAFPNATTKYVLHGITNLDKLIDMETIRFDGTEVAMVPSVEPTDVSWSINAWINGEYILIRDSQNFSSGNGYCTLRYTTTTTTTTE